MHAYSSTCAKLETSALVVGMHKAQSEENASDEMAALKWEKGNITRHVEIYPSSVPL